MNNQQQKTILLVEDDAGAMMVATHLLKSFGYAVVGAKSGEEAVHLAAGDGQIDLVLMDIELGAGMDGTEAARQILAKRNLPVVFLAAHTGKEYVARVKAIPRCGYILKNSDKFVFCARPIHANAGQRQGRSVCQLRQTNPFIWRQGSACVLGRPGDIEREVSLFEIHGSPFNRCSGSEKGCSGHVKENAIGDHRLNCQDVSDVLSYRRSCCRRVGGFCGCESGCFWSLDFCSFQNGAKLSPESKKRIQAFIYRA